MLTVFTIILHCQPEHLLWFLHHLGSAGSERAESRVNTVTFPKREGLASVLWLAS